METEFVSTPFSPQELSRISISIQPEIVWWIVGIITAIFILISASLLYHWMAYSFWGKKMKFMGTLYFLGSFVLFGIILLSALSYASSL